MSVYFPSNLSLFRVISITNEFVAKNHKEYIMVNIWFQIDEYE